MSLIREEQAFETRLSTKDTKNHKGYLTALFVLSLCPSWIILILNPDLLSYSIA